MAHKTHLYIENQARIIKAPDDEDLKKGLFPAPYGPREGRRKELKFVLGGYNDDYNGKAKKDIVQRRLGTNDDGDFAVRVDLWYLQHTGSGWFFGGNAFLFTRGSGLIFRKAKARFQENRSVWGNDLRVNGFFYHLGMPNTKGFMNIGVPIENVCNLNLLHKQME